MPRASSMRSGSLEDARGRWILGPHRESFTEYRISALVDGELRRLVIDRMFVDADGKRWIVDYKTSAHEGAGLEEFLDLQLERYARQLGGYSAAFAGEDVSLGLYFPLVKGWRQWRGEKTTGKPNAETQSRRGKQGELF